jgi:hypothetical protein
MFGEVDRVSLRQFYGYRRAKLCVSTFPEEIAHKILKGASTLAQVGPLLNPAAKVSSSTTKNNPPRSILRQIARFR